MTDAAGEAADIHDRMPVILEGEARETWQKGSQEDARALCTGYTGDVVIEKVQGKEEAEKALIRVQEQRA